MKKNMGPLDKAIRVIVALIVLALYFTGVISGWVAIILGIFAVVFILTSIISFCPLYTLFNINTCKTKKG